jgi:cytidylate kinase
MASTGTLPDPVAIDGPAASGKSTIGRVLAERFGYHFLDTGLMYRAFTLAALEQGVPPDAAACEALVGRLRIAVDAGVETRVWVDGVDVTDRLREPEVEANVSRYSALVPVRETLVKLQREIARRGMAVLAGRDIGTVVLPDAPLKLYLDASEEARARRRNVQAGGARQEPLDTRAQIARRDQMDSTRATAPLVAASDAIIIDTTAMTLDEVIAVALEKVECART